MEIGNKNVKFGWAWLLLFLILGFYLLMRVADPTWSGMQRMVWKAAHVHGNLLAFLNILYGLVIDKTKIADWLKITGSWLAILGTISFTGALFLMPFLMQIAVFEIIGAAAIIIAVGILAYGQLSS